MLTEMISSLKAEALPPVLVKGLPTEVDYIALDNLATAIAEKHKTL
jgi:hypothetical protein